MHFIEGKRLHVKLYIIKMCFLGPNLQLFVIICSDNGVAQNMRQSIIWTNDGLVDAYMRHSASKRWYCYAW